MLEGALLGTVGFAATMGVATFFSPCAYPLLPGYVAYYVSEAEGDGAALGAALARGVAAGVGVLATFAALFAASFVVGNATLSRVTVFEPLVGAVLVGFGALVALGRAPSLSVALPRRRRSVLGFGVFGAGYALAAAGCVAPLFVGVVSKAISLPGDAAAVVMATYAGVVGALMLSITVATGTGMLAGASRLSGHAGTVERVAGVVMVLAGVGQLYVAYGPV